MVKILYYTHLNRFLDCRFTVEAQRDFHMTKIKDSVKLLSRHFYTTTAVAVDHYDPTTAIAVRPLSSAVPSTEAMEVQTTTTVRVLVAGKKFRSDTTTAAVTTPKTTTTSVATTAVTTSISTVSTTESISLSLASQIPLRELIIVHSAVVFNFKHRIIIMEIKPQNPKRHFVLPNLFYYNLKVYT